MLLGRTLGKYEIRSKIGEGGMGEVYLAHDKQLNRNVALKILLREFCRNEDRVQRFKLEAKAASALNHPNIITIHEIDEFDEMLFITTEFVDGVTLREKIERRQLSILDSIRIAEQIADALAVAHEARIIHRDIKPENVMIRLDGYVKILDFGLAKPALESGAEDDTIQIIKTQPGLVMGSVRYMSPEQARGKPTDEKTDIWSLGVVLYEMLSGQNPFRGETISDSLAALIHIEPQPLEDIPVELQRILRRTLKKKTSERYQTIKDLALDLKDLRAQLEQKTAESRAIHTSYTADPGRHKTSENMTLIHRTFSAENETIEDTGWVNTQRHMVAANIGWRLLPIFIIACAVTAIAGAWIYLPGLYGNQAAVFRSIQVSSKTDDGMAYSATVSPNGKLVAFVDKKDRKPKLVVRQLSTDTTIDLVESSAKGFRQPTFSPDGEFIYYVQVENGVGTLSRVSTLGGPSTQIANDVDSRVVFSPDGQRLAFLRHNPTDGGDTILTADNEGRNLESFVDTKTVGYDRFSDLVWSNDGEKLLLAGFRNVSQPVPQISVITVNVNLENREPGEPKELRTLNAEGWVDAGNFEMLQNNKGIVFIGKRNTGDNLQIWHASFPDGTLKQVTTDTSDYGSLSVSADGETIVTTKVDKISSLVAFNPESKEISQLISESRTFLGYMGVSEMPDGRILYSRMTGKEINIFSVSPDGSGEIQLTRDNQFNFDPVPTPDGKYIVFTSNRNQSFSIWRMNAAGGSPVQLTSVKDGRDGQLQISEDGRMVIFVREKRDGGKGTIMRVSIDGGEPEIFLPESDRSNMMPQISPDGRTLAYLSLEYDSQTSVFDASINIAPMTTDEIGKPTKQMKFDLHNRYRWAPDGRSLTFVSREDDDNLSNIRLDTGKLQPLTDFKSGNLLNFSWSRDGRKILIVRGISNSDLVLIRDMDGT